MLNRSGQTKQLTSEKQAQFILAERVRALYLQAPTSNLTVFGICTLLFFILRGRLDVDLLGAWTLLMYGVAAYRLFLWWRHRQSRGNLSDRVWLNRYSLGSIVMGVCWSLIYLFLITTDDIVVYSVLWMLMFAVISSAVAILSVHLPAFIGYTYPQALALVGSMSSQNFPAFPALSLGVGVFLMMLTLFARNTNKQFMAQVNLVNENQGLVLQLNTEIAQREHVIEEQTEELRQSNRNLEGEILERKKAEDTTKIQYGLLRSVLDSTPDLIFFKNYHSQDGTYLGCNEAFSRFVGRPMEEITGRNDLALFGTEVGEFFRSKDREMLSENTTKLNEEWVVYPGPGGQRVLLSTLKTPFYGEDNQTLGVLGVSRDITEQKKTEEALREQECSLRHLAHHDPLTGLPNRLLMTDRLTQSIRKARRTGAKLAVCFIDLDHFKEINDSLGHTVGDQLLKAVSQRLRDSIREEDTVARLGGDEFTILIEDLTESAAIGALADKVLSTFSKPFQMVDQELSITTSIGISIFPADGSDTEMLLRNADAAMYHAKSEGRNAYRFYSADMTERARTRVAVESALRQALNKKQFLLYYQPQYELGSGRLVGAEALIRWQHPTNGLVLPGSFIPIAEDTGQIVQIGAWVLENACAQMKYWQDAGMADFKMAINLSGRQTLNSGLVETVNRVVRTTGCNPRNLELEITEGFLIQQPERSRAVLQELCNLGIEIAVDDFGTGYSSLSYLKQFPISKLKIDQSFVHDIPFDTNDRAISTAIIALGKSLGLAVVAEGVENREQVEFLSANGCDQVQGFFYSKPLSADSFWKYWRDLQERDAAQAR